MDDLLEDVDKIRAKVEGLVGEEQRQLVDPNKIFAQLEALMEVPPEIRVERIVTEMVAEIKEPLVVDEEVKVEERGQMEVREDVGFELRGEVVVDSLRTTPTSVISINDDDSQDSGMIDLTSLEEDLCTQRQLQDKAVLEGFKQEGGGDTEESEEDMFDETVSLETGLRRDTERVLRILADEETPLARDYEEVRAYLEAHLLKPNRVQIVVEEFLGMAQEQDPSRSPSPPRGPSPPPGPSDKGKGKGKKTAGSRVGAHAISPDLNQEVEDVRRKRPLSPQNEEIASSEVAGKKSKTETDGGHMSRGEPLEEMVDTGKSNINEGDIATDVKKSNRSGKSSKRAPSSREVITEEMLHGPFDFSKHRQVKSSHQRLAHKLRPDLQEIVEEVSRPRKQVLTPPRLKLVETPRSPERTPPTTPSRNYIVPGKLTGPATRLPDQIHPRSPVIQPARLVIPPSPEIRARTPSVELVGEEVTVLEIPEENGEVTELVSNLTVMFPDTPKDYILARAEDLVGRPAAINRFTEELLMSPEPPHDWRQVYAKPFSVLRHSPVPGRVEEQGRGEVEEIADPTQPLPPHPPNDEPPPLPNLSSNPSLPLAPLSRSPPSLDQRISATAGPASEVQTTDKPKSNVIPSETSTNDSSTSTKLQDTAQPPQNMAGPSSSSGTVETELDHSLLWERERQEQMVSMFPNVCPDWLLSQVQSIVAATLHVPAPDPAGGPQPPDKDLLFQAKVEELFSTSLEELAKLPTRAQWETKKKQQAELEKWSGAMSVNDMLELYEDDPEGYFTDPNRKPESESYKLHALAGLKDFFRFHSITEIEKCFKKSKCLFTPAFKQLQHLINSGRKTRKTQRPDFEIKFPTDPCIEFLKEKKFCELEEKIKEEKARREADREALVEAARLAGTLVECKCCYSSDCLQEDMVQCKGGHLYCRECVSRGCSVAIGDGKTIIECLGHCKEEIGWQELQKAVAPNVLSKLLQRRQAEEVGAAGLESLVTCPFCPYQTIMESELDKVLACRNPECGRESCRLCREPNHVPLRCDEVEKKDEEEARKKIEEQLSEAMIRECWKCKAKYFKEEGCNKMTCPKPGCGAKMCYLCKQPVKDYTHFYGQGGNPSATKTCPLWTDNKLLHEQEIANAAAKAKEELAAKNLKLKHDPTKDIAMPAQPINAGRLGVAAPELEDVIAPGVPREEIVRQQRQIEEMIRGGRAVWFPGGPAGVHPGLEQLDLRNMHGMHHGGAHAWQNGFIQRMGEILRLREQNRANQRLVRQREQQALRDIQQVNQDLVAQHVDQFVNVAAPPPVRAFGIPQAVPEPAPFLDLVEAQGRNIHVVQQQRVGAVAGAHFLGARGAPPHPAVMIPAGAPVFHAAQHEERRQRQEVVREQLEQNRRVARERERMVRVEQERLMERRRQMTNMQRERAVRSREEAVRRLRRNREEVLRRQRRTRGAEAGAEVRVERVPNAYQMEARAEQAVPGAAAVPVVKAGLADGRNRAGMAGEQEQHQQRGARGEVQPGAERHRVAHEGILFQPRGVREEGGTPGHRGAHRRTGDVLAHHVGQRQKGTVEPGGERQRTVVFRDEVQPKGEGPRVAVGHVQPGGPQRGAQRVRGEVPSGGERQRGPADQTEGQANTQQRGFNFQEILDLDGLNPEYLADV